MKSSILDRRPIDGVLYMTAPSRNFLFGPGIQNFDVALFKRFAIAESKRFELRWEVFNSLNRPNFLNPVGAFTNPLFGRLTSARDPRIMQVALKFYF